MSYFHQFKTFISQKLYVCHYLMSMDNFFSPIFNIDDQNTKFVFASKITQAVYLNPNL